MEQIYKKVYCKDRLPSKPGDYDTNQGERSFDFYHDKSVWLRFIDWWLEEQTAPTQVTEDFIEKFIRENTYTQRIMEGDSTELMPVQFKRTAEQVIGWLRKALSLINGGGNNAQELKPNK